MKRKREREAYVAGVSQLGRHGGGGGSETPPGVPTSRGPTGDTDTKYKGAGGASCTDAITRPQSHCSPLVSSSLLLSKYLEERSEQHSGTENTALCILFKGTTAA